MRRVFNAKLKCDQKLQALRESWLTGREFRLRNACCTLLQAYVAYHPCPELKWAQISADQLAVHGAMLRTFFRHKGEIVDVAPLGNSKAKIVGRREAQLVDWKLMQQVAAALEDITELYESDISPEDLIDEARNQYQLVLVLNPRMVFWEGQELVIDWDNKEKQWELLEQFVIRGTGEGVDRHHLTGEPNLHAFSGRRNRLINTLREAAGESRLHGQQLASRIPRMKDGRCRLNVDPRQKNIFDLNSDSWLVDA